jgi:hypothetical protein
MAVFIYPPPGAASRARPVEFREAKEGSQDCAISGNAQVYKTIWKVAWADAEAAKVALLGTTSARPAFILGGVPVRPAYFTRDLPHAHPKAPWLFCTDITRTEGRTPVERDDDGMAAFEWAYLYCTYTKLFCPVLPDSDVRVTGTDPPWGPGAGSVPNEARLARFVRRRRRSQLSFMSSRVGSWSWVDVPAAQPNSRVGMPLPWRVPKLRVLLTWMRIPLQYLNEAYINDTIGTTNAGAFGGYRDSSLLLNGADWPDWQPIPGQDGFQVDVTFDITYYPEVIGGPNYFPDPNRGNTYHAVEGRGVLPVRQPAPARDWSPMFQPINI